MKVTIAISDEGRTVIAISEKEDGVDVPPVVMVSQADVERTANASGDIACRLGHCADQSHMHVEIGDTTRAVVSCHQRDSCREHCFLPLNRQVVPLKFVVIREERKKYLKRKQRKHKAFEVC